MAAPGPFYVDFDAVDGGDGSIGSPWNLAPGQTGASSQTNYSVTGQSATDPLYINIKNGSTSTLRLIVPADNMVYRGYGISDNVLTLTLPAEHDCTKTRTLEVVREAGVHEGMWTLDGSANNNDGACISTNGKSNITFEDVILIGYTDRSGTARPSIKGTDTGNPSGLTMRRFYCLNSGSSSIVCQIRNVLLEYGKTEYSGENVITLVATANNGSRASSVDICRYLDLRYSNQAYEGAAASGDFGTFFIGTPLAGVFQSSFTIHDIYIYKNTTAKQAFVLHDCRNGLRVDNIHALGESGIANLQVLMGTVRGSWSFSNMYFEQWASTEEENPLFRFASNASFHLDTGAKVKIRNVIARGDYCPGLLQLVTAGTAYQYDGAIEIDHIYIDGTLSRLGQLYGSLICSYTGTETYGANFTLTVSNMVVATTGVSPILWLETAHGNSASIVFKNNMVPIGATFKVDVNEYVGVAAFEAYHTYATNNIEEAPEIDTTTLKPSSIASNVVAAGTHISYSNDAAGHAFWNPPSIGAYEVPRTRSALTQAREMRV